MAEEDITSVAVPGNADLGGSSSGKIDTGGKPSFSDKECVNDANKGSSPRVNHVEHLRRHSTGKPSSPRVTPHYLLASTGSCHDNCKSGFKPDFEEREKRPWLKKFAIRSSAKQNCVVTFAPAPVELKKSPLSRSVSFPVDLSHLQHQASSDAVSSPHRHKIIKAKIMPKNGKGVTDGSGEHSPSVMRRASSCISLESGHNTKAEKKISPPLHSPRVKAKVPYSIQTSRGAKGSNKTSDDKTISKANTKLPSSSVKKTSVSPGSSLSSKPSIDRKTAMKPRNDGRSKLLSSVKNTLQKDIGKTCDEYVPEKTLHVVAVETKAKPSDSTEVSEIIFPLPELNLSLIEEREEDEDTDEDEVEQQETDKEEEEEKNEYESDEGDESIVGNILKPLKEGHIISESGDSMLVKLKFKEGMVLDIDSEIKRPKRLRFRRGRIVEAHGVNHETHRRTFNKRHSSKATINSTKEQKIVLRHQDLEEKKDDQGLLLNNVIEETAIKLAESRKSKVKALVGAFETVMSRRDSKPARRSQLVA